ncbi:hypothetical protein ANRL3_00654 [Anaerolineae bacterium]|nr:hypothetical protein ANRL3_00654 [Anaerolineae bacterium]
MNPKGTFSLTPEQKQKILGIVIQGVVTMVLAILAVLGYNVIVVQPQFAQLAQPGAIEQVAPPAGIGVRAVPYNISALPMRCKNTDINCIAIWNGSDLSMYSDGGTTRKIWIDGLLGDITAAGTVTVTNLVSQTVGFNSTAASTIVTTTVGSGGVGTLTVHAPATFTDTVNMSNAIITNIGNAGTDFDASGGLTANGGFTGTVNSVTQNSITKIGKQTSLSVTGALNTDAALTAATGNYTTTLGIGGINFPGTARWGTSATYTSADSLTHGFSITPTVCFIPQAEITTTYTITATGFSANMTTSGTPVYWFCGK